jgi:hypothetical protein
MSLVNTDGKATWHHPSGRTSVIDLLFCHNSLLSHYHSQFLSDSEGRGSSDHSIFLFNFQKHIDYFGNDYIPQDSEEEADFLRNIADRIITKADADTNIEDAFHNIYKEAHAAWLCNAKRAKIGSNPTRWWNEECQDAKEAFERSRSRNNRKTYHKAIQTARSEYFQRRIQNMSALLKPWEGVRWTKPRAPPAYSTIKRNG